MSTLLQETIQTAHDTQRALVAATNNPNNFDQRELVRLRSKFQENMLAIAHSARDDANLKADDLKYREFMPRHGDIQASLSHHRSTWMLRQIEEDWDGYNRATAELKTDQDSFFEWAKHAIR